MRRVRRRYYTDANENYSGAAYAAKRHNYAFSWAKAVPIRTSSRVAHAAASSGTNANVTGVNGTGAAGTVIAGVTPNETGVTGTGGAGSCPASAVKGQLASGHQRSGYSRRAASVRSRGRGTGGAGTAVASMVVISAVLRHGGWASSTASRALMHRLGRRRHWSSWQGC